MWGPSVGEVDCKDRYIRAGSSGRIRTPVGIWVPFVVGSFEPEAYWDWRVAGVPAWAFAYGLVCRLALLRIDRWLKPAGKRDGQ